MQSFDKFWSIEKTAMAELCEENGCRLFYCNLQDVYFVVRIYADGSVLHTKESEIFRFSKPKGFVDLKEFLRTKRTLII